MDQYINTVSHQDLTDFFYSRHPQLEKYLFWQVRSHDIAEELAQETYVRFLRQSKPQQVCNLNAFLFAIAGNLARDYLRNIKRGQNREFVPLDKDEIADSKPQTEDIIAKQCLEAQLQQAIASLPEKTREIFLLYRADELSYKHIAAQLAISERAVEYHLRKAILHCRRRLINQEGV